MVKLPVKLPSKPALSIHPTNIQIIEITPSSRASDYGKQVCAHLLLFHNTYHLWSAHIFLHDTQHGTVLPTFSLISLPKMKMKTCRFRNISDSATCSTSCQRFLKIHLVADFFKIINSGRTIPTVIVLLHLFLDLLAKNGNKDVSIREYFGFSHVLHFLLAVFRNSFLLWEIIF